MSRVVLHDHQLARDRANALAKQEAAAMAKYRPAGGSLWKPDPNSRFMRATKVANLQHAIQLQEKQKRSETGESVKPFNRKKDYYERLGVLSEGQGRNTVLYTTAEDAA